jgi:predicted O-methyltransferase YrrM
MRPFAIVSASDSQFFELVRDLVRSIRDKPQGREVPVFVMDAGLAPPERQWLQQNRVTVIALPWPYPLEVPGPQKALAMRCRIPELIPDHRVYLWVDADTWVQDWAAIELYRRTAEERHWCMTGEVDRSYDVNAALQWHVQMCRQLFGSVLAQRVLSKPLLNAGVFAARHDAPHWGPWRARVESQLIATDADFCLDQTAINLVADVDGYDIAILPASCNWVCHRALPWATRDGRKLLDPHPPHQPLGIIHMTAVTKKWKFVLRTQGGPPVLRSLRYNAPPEPCTDLLAAQLDLARADSLTHHHGQAMRVLREMLARHPGHAPALALLGQVAAREGDLETAVAALEQALRLEPADAASHALLGAAYLQQGRCDDAADAFRAALALAPASPEVERQLARAAEMRNMPPGDYVAPGLVRVRPDAHFPGLARGDAAAAVSPHLTRLIPHNWYVDRRATEIGFLTRDEAHILFNFARRLEGRSALEIGCFLGFGTAHLALGGMRVDAVDPALANPAMMASARDSLASAGVLGACRLLPLPASAAIERLAAASDPWSLVFIDADESVEGVSRELEAAADHLAETAVILLRNAESPAAAAALRRLAERGWSMRLYGTAPAMGVAWRGDLVPVEHVPDPAATGAAPAPAEVGRQS